MTTMTDDEAVFKMNEAQLRAGHALTTRDQYQAWVRRYRRARREKVCRDLQGFLTYLATDEEARVNAKTVRQALNAMKFYHEKVLGIEIPPNSLEVPKINKNRNVPVFLSHGEVLDLLARMEGVARLQAEMLYGTGGRITALLRLRLKDVDMERGLVTFRHDKGGKSRTVRLPRSLKHRLMTHIARVRLMWETDQRRGMIYPTAEPSEMKKLGRKRYGTLPFCFLFPSRDVHGDERWHATDRALTEGIRRAAEEAGLMKRVTPHTLRHSNATALLDRGEDIRTIQDHLGHEDVKTTEIYTHAMGTRAVVSPMDAAPPVRVEVDDWCIPFPDRSRACG